MKTLDALLEEWKQFGLYALNLFYGEDIGCDDSDCPQEDRRVRVMGCPVGCLGEAKVLWCGKLAEFRAFDPKATRPEELGNPPGPKAHSEGWFIWGASPESVKNAMAFLYRESVDATN